MRIKKHQFHIVLAVLLAGVLLLNIASQLWYGKVSVTGSSAAPYEVVIGNQVFTQNSSKKLRPGTYTAVIRGKRVAKLEQKITIGAFSTTTIANNVPALSNEQIAANVTGIAKDNLKLYAIEFFNNETWLVASVGLANEPSDTIPVIAKYAAGEWVSVDSGTGIEYEDIVGLPNNVRAYLENRSLNE